MPETAHQILLCCPCRSGQRLAGVPKIMETEVVHAHPLAGVKACLTASPRIGLNRLPRLSIVQLAASASMAALKGRRVRSATPTIDPEAAPTGSAPTRKPERSMAVTLSGSRYRAAISRSSPLVPGAVRLGGAGRLAISAASTPHR